MLIGPFCCQISLKISSPPLRTLRLCVEVRVCQTRTFDQQRTSLSYRLQYFICAHVTSTDKNKLTRRRRERRGGAESELILTLITTSPKKYFLVLKCRPDRMFASMPPSRADAHRCRINAGNHASVFRRHALPIMFPRQKQRASKTARTFHEPWFLHPHCEEGY